MQEDAIQWLSYRGYDPVYGARPLKRVIQKELVDPLSTLVLDGTMTPERHAIVTIQDDGIHIDCV